MNGNIIDIADEKKVEEAGMVKSKEIIEVVKYSKRGMNQPENNKGCSWAGDEEEEKIN